MLLVIPCLFIAVIAGFWPAIHSSYIWDDNNYVTENYTLRTFDGLKRIWTDTSATPQYYPLVHTGFWLEFQAWGLSPRGYHITNVVLHLLNSVLVWLILSRLKLPGAGVAGIVFAVHPVHVESVAWITERKNVLSGFFYLAAMLLFITRVIHSENDSDEPKESVISLDNRFSRLRSVTFVVLVLGLYVCALLSKTVTASLPVAFLIIIWWKRQHIQRYQIILITLMFLVGIPLGLTTAYLEKHHVGASGAAWDYSLLERLFIASGAIQFYLQKLVFPWPIVFVYGHWPTDMNVWNLGCVLLVIAAFSIGIFFRWRAFLACFIFFCVSVFPALGFIDVFPMQYTFVADHYIYLASLGPIVFLICGLAAKMGGYSPSAQKRFATGAVLLIGVLVIRTHIECFKFQNEQALWVDTIQKNPRCQMAYVNLGNLLRMQGNVTDAEQLYRRAIELEPNDPTANVNLAALRYLSGHHDEARRILNKVVAANPENDLVLYNLAILLQETGEHERALKLLRKAVHSVPENAPAQNALGLMLKQQGQLDEALDCFQLACRHAPESPDFWTNYGSTLLENEQMQKAKAALNRAIELQPGHAVAHANLADFYWRSGNIEQSREHARIAIREFPNQELLQRILGQE